MSKQLLADISEAIETVLQENSVLNEDVAVLREQLKQCSTDKKENLETEVTALKNQTTKLKAMLTDIMIKAGAEQLGKPYLFGSTLLNDKTFDCSDLTHYMYHQIGIALPRNSFNQADVGTKITDIGDIEVGDLLFFNASSTRNTPNNIDHVAFYIGNNQLIEAFPNVGVRIADITGAYIRTFRWATRLL